MSETHTPVTKELGDYIRSVSLRDSDLLARLRKETATLPDHMMQLMAEEAQFLAFLARLIGAKKTLEVGVFTGYSSLCVAMALPLDGRIVACDVSEEWTSIARRYWKEAGVDKKIDLRIRPAVETLKQLVADGQRGTFDMAFIDADKQNYQNYYELALELLRPGGLIAADNVLWDGSVIDPKDQDASTVAIREFNKKVHADERVDISLVPIGDGLMLARKR